MLNRIDPKKFAQKLDSQGKKVKYLRQLSGLSRIEFSQKYDISESTLRSWELNISPISDRLMEKFLEGLLQEGISISASWIKEASGEALTFLTSHEVGSSLSIGEKSVEDEINLFLKSGSNRFVKVISDSKNTPFFKEGDLVGGELTPPSSEILFLNNFCLVQTQNMKDWNVYLVRTSKSKGLYTLICAQSRENPIDYPILYNIKIDKVAPIIWFRKLEKP